ncbi:MAG: right-handed parallel beta-helix repeat-containing protein [Candidatus Omnitrophica bacterium]|nr:right-handed parallel beta-helix repeat-containing protein [Candidatus Omnitrophota bacterium]
MLVCIPPTKSYHILFILFLFLPFSSESSAATFLVTNTDDSGDGSLRSAIETANSTTNVGGAPDRIEFNIPGGGGHTIAPFSFLPAISEPVEIDGYTQPGATANSNPITMGSNAVIQIELNGAGAPGSSGLVITSGSSTVRGLAITGWTSYGLYLQGQSGNSIEGNFIGLHPDGETPSGNFTGIRIENSSANLVGGLMLEARNVISAHISAGVEFTSAFDNLVQGNFIGTDSQGTHDLGNNIGISLSSSSSNNLIGGAALGSRNIISNNHFAGVVLSNSFVTNNRIQGNFIGTDVTGSVALGNFDGVYIDQIGGIGNNLIGGSNTGEANLISGNAGNGIFLGRSISEDIVQGNFIGTDATGAGPLPNLGQGILINGLDGFDHTIGGVDPGAGNTIAYNAGAGVFVNFLNTGHSILGNSVFSNEGLGIDLSEVGNPGQTPNDAGDSDTGGNDLQNYPILSSAQTTSSKGIETFIQGSLQSAPDTSFRIEFFNSSQCDPSDHGEGEKYLGSLDVTTSATGTADFESTLSTPSLVGNFLTATATVIEGPGAFGDTSEFSPCFPISPPCDSPFPDFAVNGRADAADLLLLLMSSRTSDPSRDLTCDEQVHADDFFQFALSWYRATP